VIGAEPIAWRPLADAVDALGESGLTLDRICPAYGLAEATLAVTMATPGAGPHAIEVEPAALDDGLLSLAEGDSPSVTVVSSGTPLPNTVVEVLGDHGVGALRIRTPSLASGHVGSDHPDHFRDSFTTTDIGFQIGAELFVLGRADDIVTLRGEQRSARRIEAACEGHDAIRAGGVAYVVTDAGATLLVELPRGATASRRLELDLADRARSEGAIVDSVRFLAPGQLPRTPSGKLQRFRARALVG
jgi:acyl-CoA synthetase (AMP-forming)/AMP-acid ligase II